MKQFERRWSATLVVFSAALLVAASLGCGSDGDGSTSTSSGASGGSSGNTSSGATSSGATSSGGVRCESTLPVSNDPNPAPGCTSDDDCVVRPTGNACCPQGDQAMTKAAAAALPEAGPYCACGETPCAPREPILKAHCAGGVCELGPRRDAGPDSG